MKIGNYEKAVAYVLYSFQKNTAASILLRCARALKNKVDKKKYLYCGNVVKEFITTEQTYCEQLSVIENIIRQPLLQLQQPILTYDQIRLLFSSITVIYGVNKALFNNLQEKLSVYTQNSRFGKTILTFTPYLKLYSQYCQIFPQISDLTVTLKAPHPFSIFFKTQMKSAPQHLQRFDLGSLLITPIQRLPRYRLLLKDLLKHLSDKDLDFPDVKKSLEEIEKVTLFVNTQSKKQENNEKVVQLQTNVRYLPPTLLLLQPGREMVDSTTATLTEKMVNLTDNGRVVKTMHSEEFNAILEKGETLNKNLTVEGFERSSQVEVILFTDMILFLEHSKNIFGGEVITYKQHFLIEKAKLFMVGKQIHIGDNNTTIRIEFEDSDKWYDKLKGVFSSCHTTMENLLKRRSVIHL
ncbi:guanine nucleotide exchange factor, putative [Entamoeba invadens IP1]|uniref:Guanine nucleotide exchange factor, putative n=1 Tax=Entamoeba invadens IP1 TaxID=370355 RepID=A0A0A1TYC6_ENTIV|nr:guanine nucleotide exchange factor, putative [Entamoeba invadens IP1]ELP86490.1 guanine nucleotide exchange factor, putative [Entamoeba invadens IP1]|eukprot:XP_004185836.1 guanine nucleotide exchange factor, putative [Entamoeba invadens IP1]